MWARCLAVTAVLAGIGTSTAMAANAPSEMTLYDWMFPAPVVLAGQVLDEAGKLTDVQVAEVFRGEVDPGGIIAVNIKKANRYREDFQSRVKLDEGKTYLFLLEPTPSKDPGDRTRYQLVRGVSGTREVPAEGASAYLEAARRFAQLQSINSDELHWHALAMMLEERNPVLLLTALDEFLKFRRESQDLALRARPLLQHPRPEIREKALELCGRVLTNFPRDEIADPAGIEMEIIALARRDPSADVRIAATHALRGFADAGIEEVWEEISQDDPDQSVRYTAERLLYEREMEVADRSENTAH